MDKLMVMVSWVIFIFHLAASFMMIGIVWLVQVINYPLFRMIPKDLFARFYQAHLDRSQWVIVPLMLTEFCTGAFLLLWPITQVSYWLYQLNFALIVAIWLETFFMQLPIHRLLQKNHSLEAIDKLISSNWLRTFTWSIHGLVLIAILY